MHMNRSKPTSKLARIMRAYSLTNLAGPENGVVEGHPDIEIAHPPVERVHETLNNGTRCIVLGSCKARVGELGRAPCKLRHETSTACMCVNVYIIVPPPSQVIFFVNIIFFTLAYPKGSKPVVTGYMSVNDPGPQRMRDNTAVVFFSLGNIYATCFTVGKPSVTCGMYST